MAKQKHIEADDELDAWLDDVESQVRDILHAHGVAPTDDGNQYSMDMNGCPQLHSLIDHIGVIKLKTVADAMLAMRQLDVVRRSLQRGELARVECIELERTFSRLRVRPSERLAQVGDKCVNNSGGRRPIPDEERLQEAQVLKAKVEELKKSKHWLGNGAAIEQAAKDLEMGRTKAYGLLKLLK